MNIKSTTGFSLTRLSGYRFLLVILSIATLLLFESMAHADTRWMPSLKHFQALEAGKDCSVYRSVLLGQNEQLTQKRSLLKDSEALTRQSYAALEQCAKSHGVVSLQNSEGALRANEVCGENYADWLNEGKNRLLLEEDVAELTQELRQVKSILRDYCKATVVATVP